MGIAAVSQPNCIHTTQFDEDVRPAYDVVGRDSRADAPSRLYVAAINYVLTSADFLRLAVPRWYWYSSSPPSATGKPIASAYPRI